MNRRLVGRRPPTHIPTTQRRQPTGAQHRQQKLGLNARFNVLYLCDVSVIKYFLRGMLRCRKPPNPGITETAIRLAAMLGSCVRAVADDGVGHNLEDGEPQLRRFAADGLEVVCPWQRLHERWARLGRSRCV